MSMLSTTRGKLRKKMMRREALWKDVSDTVTAPTYIASSLEGTSTQKKDLELSLHMKLADTIFAFAVNALRDSKGVWWKLKNLNQSTQEGAVDTTHCKLQQIRMVSIKTVMQYTRRSAGSIIILAAAGRNAPKLEKTRSLLRALSTSLYVNV